MFARGVPVSVFSLALVVDGEAKLGVVYDPFTDKLYSAIGGGGAFCNDLPIHVSDIDYSDKAEISNLDLWPESEIYDEISNAVHELQRVSYLVGIGSVIHACMLVASGDFVSAIFAGTKGKNVDIAAAKVIVEEAGGKVTDIHGNDQRYDGDIKGAIISNGVVHDEIIRIIKS
jgi:fructose-1,6-bisphosphatase/inositol monophosphatase family enzyme